MGYYLRVTFVQNVGDTPIIKSRIFAQKFSQTHQQKKKGKTPWLKTMRWY